MQLFGRLKFVVQNIKLEERCKKNYKYMFENAHETYISRLRCANRVKSLLSSSYYSPTEVPQKSAAKSGGFLRRFQRCFSSSSMNVPLAMSTNQSPKLETAEAILKLGYFIIFYYNYSFYFFIISNLAIFYFK